MWRQALSLRTRFVMGLGIVLLPFVLAAALGQFYLLPRITEPLEEITTEALERLEPIVELRGELLAVAIRADDYLVSGNVARLEQFVQSGRWVDRAFEQLLTKISIAEEERKFIESAEREWKEIKNRAAVSPQPHGLLSDSEIQRALEALDAHIEQTMRALDQAQRIVTHDITKAKVTAHKARQQAILLTAIAFLAALAVSIVAGFTLSGSIVGAIDALARGVMRFSEGKFSHRVPMTRDDELGRLGLAFNTMAERLEKTHAALEELATQDSLTGLSNQREFHRLLREERERSQRYDHPFALMMLDIDHFKRVNDTYGHQKGDQVLRAVAARIRAEIRPADRVARYGGEEFAVILPETDSAAAAMVAERIRASVSAHPVSLTDGVAIPVTLSAGVAAFPGDATTEDQLFAAADRALYAAKNAGRNLVRRAQQGAAAGENGQPPLQ